MDELSRLREAAVLQPSSFDAHWHLIRALWTTDRLAGARSALRAFVLAPQDIEAIANASLALIQLGRSLEIPHWLPRHRREPARVERHDVDTASLVELYHRLLDETARRKDEGWTPSSVEASKFSMPLSKEHLDSFRRSEVSSGNQIVPDTPVDFPRLDFSRLYPPITAAESAQWTPVLRETWAGLLHRLIRNAARRPDNRAARQALDFADALILDDGRFGARLSSLPDVGAVTQKSIHATFYACRLYSLVPERGSVLEIGGGFGALASRLLRIRRDISYVLTDLPVNLILTYAYLRSFFGATVYGAFEGPISPPPGTRVMVVPPWRLSELSGRISVVVNTMSFQHMDARNHAFYGDVMRHLKARRLYHINRQIISPGDRTVHIPASDYSFLDQFDVIENDAFDERWVEVLANRKE